MDSRDEEGLKRTEDIWMDSRGEEGLKRTEEIWMDSRYEKGQADRGDLDGQQR